MRLLIDTDFYCKIGVAGLFDAALNVLGVQPSDCARLPALPHMLRRGRLPKRYGADACARLARHAESIAAMTVSDSIWIDVLTPVTDIDPGEAQLFAAAAESGNLLATADKRALGAVGKVPSIRPLLAGRVVTFEAVLLRLCSTLGEIAVRSAVTPLSEDQMVRICFSPGNASPAEALRSYFDASCAEVHPLVLWQPQAVAREGGE